MFYRGVASLIASFFRLMRRLTINLPTQLKVTLRSFLGISSLLLRSHVPNTQMHECTICVDNRDHPFPSAVIEDRGRFRLVRYSSVHSKAVHNMSRAMLLTERPASLLLARMYATQTESPKHTPSWSIWATLLQRHRTT